MLSTLLVVVLVVMLLGAVPAWPYSREWGYGPVGIVGFLLLLLLILMIARVIPAPWGPAPPPILVP